MYVLLSSWYIYRVRKENELGWTLITVVLARKSNNVFPSMLHSFLSRSFSFIGLIL